MPKIFKPGFNNTCTVNLQVFKLVLEKAEEPEIKLPTSVGSLKKQESSRKKIYLWLIDYAKTFDYVDHNKLWKILKEMAIPDHLTCFLINLCAGQEATVRTGHGTMDWFQTGKGVCQGCILSPCLFNFYAKSHGQRSLVGCSPRGFEGRTRLSNFTFTFHFHALDKEMATHSSVLAWRVPGMGETGGLPSMGLHRVGHN